MLSYAEQVATSSGFGRLEHPKKNLWLLRNLKPISSIAYLGYRRVYPLSKPVGNLSKQLTKQPKVVLGRFACLNKARTDRAAGAVC
jgi:hypothetical protein